VFGTKPLWYGSQWNAKSGKVLNVVASYESVLQRLGLTSSNRHFAEPNNMIVVDMDTFHVQDNVEIFEFDLTQHKVTTIDFEAAFLEAVRVRTHGIKHKVFIGLSSGYDSGAIMLALELLQLPFMAYNIRGREDMRIVHERIDYCKHGLATLISLNEDALVERRRWMGQYCEDFKYRTLHGSVVKDKASLGLSYILTKVRQRGGLIYISGSGADEIISDYAINGRKVFPHSNFAGIFPSNLSTIFPRFNQLAKAKWQSFFLGSQRDYLMKEELTGGAHGIESRYPFLDPYFVQEYLWLHSTVKNSAYKKPILDFLLRHKFPVSVNSKVGFTANVNLTKHTIVEEVDKMSPHVGFTANVNLTTHTIVEEVDKMSLHVGGVSTIKIVQKGMQSDKRGADVQQQRGIEFEKHSSEPQTGMQFKQHSSEGDENVKQPQSSIKYPAYLSQALIALAVLAMVFVQSSRFRHGVEKSL